MSYLNGANNITIAGGGLSGSSIAVMQIAEINKEWNRQGRPTDFPQTNIIIAETGKTIGPGGPYDQTEDIYWLNQPAYAMSPFAYDKGHFTRALKNNNPDASTYQLENSFQTRKAYGLYLSEIFHEAYQTCQDPSFPAQITKEHAAITNVDINDLGLIIKADGKEWKSDSLAIADGHFKNEFLSELKDYHYPHYFDHPLTHDTITNIPRNNDRVLIVGSGQDMMDRLAELDHYGYQGKIDVVSRRGVLPWVFEPELYHPARNIAPYQLQYFKPDNFTSDMPYDNFKQLWNQEIEHAKNNKYGIGHVLGAFYSDDAMQYYSHTQRQNPQWSKTLSVIEAIYGNPTPQPRFDLLQSYMNSGQLTAAQGDINANNIETISHGFAVSANGQSSQKYDAIINAASCARSLTDAFGTVRSHLIRALDDKNVMSWHSDQAGILQVGQQNDPRISYNGPYAHSGKWGCETFRQSNYETAKRHLSI